jgi:hypothetical protein
VTDRPTRHHRYELDLDVAPKHRALMGCAGLIAGMILVATSLPIRSLTMLIVGAVIS